MSEQGNVQTVQRLYQMFVEGDIPGILKLWTEDADMFLFGSAKIPWAGAWRGREGVERFLRTVAEVAEVEDFPDEFLAAGDNVVVLGHQRVRVRATGRIIEANWAVVWTFRDGKVSRYREYSDTAALEAGFSGRAT